MQLQTKKEHADERSSRFNWQICYSMQYRRRTAQSGYVFDYYLVSHRSRPPLTLTRTSANANTVSSSSRARSKQLTSMACCMATDRSMIWADGDSSSRTRSSITSSLTGLENSSQSRSEG